MTHPKNPVINKRTLISLVRKEAAKIRKHANERELSNLDYNTLRPTSMYNCVYGQMTGYCYSKRAMDLIVKCADKVYEPLPDMFFPNPLKDISLNGKPRRIRQGENRGQFYHSPIEVFIYKKSNAQQRRALINYLKGETAKLIL